MNEFAKAVETAPISLEFAIDTTDLQRWMSENVEGFSGPLTIEKFKGGQSNPTYRVRTPHCDYVLRRKPGGPLVKGAHAIDREARVMTALARTGFPVPRVYALCTDESVIGSAFFIMGFVEGRIFWDASIPDVPRSERAAYQAAMNATMATLHGIDPFAIGLGDYGRIGNYVGRQLSRWSEQYLSDEAAGRHPAMDRLVEWLPRHLPGAEATVVIHGDFRIDNMIFHPTEARVLAVLDWELSTLGDPLADFAYNAMMYRMPSDILGGIGGVNATEAGLLDEAAYVEAYCKHTGRSDIADLDFYIAFNMFRFAAILHGIKGRVARGTASSHDAAAMGDRFARVAELAWAQAQRI